MENKETAKRPSQRQRPVAAPEREVIRSALGLNKPVGGDIIRRNRRRRPSTEKNQPSDPPLENEPAATATVEVTVPGKPNARREEAATPEPAPVERERERADEFDDELGAEPAPEPGEVVTKEEVTKSRREAPTDPVSVQALGAAELEAAPPEAEASSATALPVAKPRPKAPKTPTRRASEKRSARSQSGAKLLQTRGLVKVYDGRAVVDGVDINVREQEIVGLLGPNGAGKTTSFYMIVGLVQPNGGSVEFNGADATNEPMYRRARLGMGYLPQEESIFRKLTVKQNIMAVLETQPYSARERKDRCHDLMRRFGIEKLANNIAITLSGGEKRRLTIARSLVTNPKLLMLDEPFSGVDPIAVGEIQDIICDLREQGLAILITDHNVRETLGIVDRAYLIYEGKVLMEGSRDELVNDPEARKLYLGQSFSM